MKSIMEEASSVAKAIEKAWESAGKPTDFSIKVFEEPKKNFIGLTVQSAKVGIFFEEKVVKTEQRVERNRPRPEAPRRDSQAPKPLKTTPEKPKLEQKRVQKQDSEVKQARSLDSESRVIWTEQMIDSAQTWLKDSLEIMQVGSVGLTHEAKNYQLKIAFDKPIIEDELKEKQLMRSFSLLMMQALRHQLKRPLRGFKIILVRS